MLNQFVISLRVFDGYCYRNYTNCVLHTLPVSPHSKSIKQFERLVILTIRRQKLTRGRLMFVDVPSSNHRLNSIRDKKAPIKVFDWSKTSSKKMMYRPKIRKPRVQPVCRRPSVSHQVSLATLYNN